jgi:hypothetical protein
MNAVAAFRIFNSRSVGIFLHADIGLTRKLSEMINKVFDQLRPSECTLLPGGFYIQNFTSTLSAEGRCVNAMVPLALL